MSSSIKSGKTLSSLKDKEQDTIPFRIEFIKELLRGTIIKPMVDLDNTETERFLQGDDNSVNEDDTNMSEYSSHDTRTLLNKKVHDFYDAIEQIGGNLMYIKSGTTGHAFKGTITGKNGSQNYAVKVVAYQKKDSGINDSRRPENAELMMIRLLSYFVVKGQTPHMILPIGTFNTSIEPFVSLIDDDLIGKNNKKYQEFVEKYKGAEYHDQVSILISEWANRGDLLDFMRKNYKKFKPLHWKVIFFQIISVLAVIHSKFPSFRHNDLKANNILISKISKNVKRYTYKVYKYIYHVPNIGYQIKLWDFDFACIPGIIDNKKVSSKWTRKINVTPEQNRYYDVHYFFNTLIKKAFFPQFMTDSCVPQEAKDFVDRIVPNKYKSGRYVHERGRILINDEYLTPDEILKTDPFFEEFRKSKKRDTGTIKIQPKLNRSLQNRTKKQSISKNSIDDTSN
jgi:serine/threonine protein kinase